MSITDDRNHIGNEWTCDKKLSEVDVRLNKWRKTYQNVHFSFFRQLIGLAVGRWFVPFLPTVHESVGKHIFRSEAEKTFFTSILMGRSGNQKQDYFLSHRISLPCCGFSLESHWRCVFNEYPQNVFLRNKQKPKYPPYLFHFLCAQRRLRSAWASAQSDQSLRCPLIEQLRPQGFFMRTVKTLISRGGWPSLIWVENPRRQVSSWRGSLKVLTTECVLH